MTRKTVKVADLVHKINHKLSIPDNGSLNPVTRMALAYVLEEILHEADAYAGYNYQASEFLPAEEQGRAEGPLRDGYDETRRVYFVHRKLRG